MNKKTPCGKSVRLRLGGDEVVVPAGETGATIEFCHVELALCSQAVLAEIV